MSNQRRISVEEGVRAYQKSGAIPSQGHYYEPPILDEDPYSTPPRPALACGLGALWVVGAFGEPEKTIFGTMSLDPIITILGDEYVSGFEAGFDGASCDRLEPRYLEGEEDGKALWEAVKDGVPPVESPVPDYPPVEQREEILA